MYRGQIHMNKETKTISQLETAKKVIEKSKYVANLSLLVTEGTQTNMTYSCLQPG
jgi:hypothetical protein